MRKFRIIHYPDERISIWEIIGEAGQPSDRVLKIRSSHTDPSMMVVGNLLGEDRIQQRDFVRETTFPHMKALLRYNAIGVRVL